jgi:hypothetical protein
LATVALLAAPAVAAPPSIHENYPGLGWGNTLLIFVGIPVGIVGVVAGLVYVPSAIRGGRYRPNEEWDYDPLWFNGPDDPELALSRVTKVPKPGGGASGSW